MRQLLKSIQQTHLHLFSSLISRMATQPGRCCSCSEKGNALIKLQLKTNMENFIQYTPILLAIIGLIVMYIQSVWVRKQPAGTEKMQSISKSIKEGALAFLNAEYRLLLIFVILPQEHFMAYRLWSRPQVG